jgi:hypothetical protein
MTKEIRSLTELRNLVEAEVRKYPDFDEVSPLNAYWHERDGEGCNWDITHWRGPAFVAAAARNAIYTEVRRMQAHYDASEPV